MRKAILILVCLLLVAPTVTSQRKRPKPKPKPDPEKYLEPIPPDELLFTAAERREILSHSGWREASKSAEDANKLQDVIYYDRKRVEHRPNNMIRAWLKTQTVKVGESGFQSFLMEWMEYDCSESRMRALSSTKYDQHYQSIENLGQTGWALVIPDTVGERLHGILCKGLADNEQVDYDLASQWFREARQHEKSGNTNEAQFWYEAALNHAPNNLKIVAAIARVKRAKD
jgi:hypothetical protein